MIEPDDMIALVNANEFRAVPKIDPRRAQLLALYDASAEADKVLIIQIAKLHAERNAAKGKK